jgi:hypothetical protein
MAETSVHGLTGANYIGKRVPDYASGGIACRDIVRHGMALDDNDARSSVIYAQM